MIFFLERQVIKCSYTYQPLSNCKILIKNLRVDSEWWGCASFSGPKWPICLEKNFFITNHCYYFHPPFGPFIVQNLKKFLQWIQNHGDAPFVGPNWYICLKEFFFGGEGNYYCHSHLPISPFHCVNILKNSSGGSWVRRMCNFWAQNGPFPQMRNFSENLLMSLFSFIHANLHAKNQSQILIY